MLRRSARLLTQGYYRTYENLNYGVKGVMSPSRSPILCIRSSSRKSDRSPDKTSDNGSPTRKKTSATKQKTRGKAKQTLSWSDGSLYLRHDSGPMVHSSTKVENGPSQVSFEESSCSSISIIARLVTWPLTAWKNLISEYCLLDFLLLRRLTLRMKALLFLLLLLVLQNVGCNCSWYWYPYVFGVFSVESRSTSHHVTEAELSGAMEKFEKRIQGWMADTEQGIQQSVQQALNVHIADGTGMADFALESLGGRVIYSHCSEGNAKYSFVSILGMRSCNENPQNVIQPETSPGKCWAFQGNVGFLVIGLALPVKVTHVTLEHLPKALSPTGRIDSAPREFAVYGMSKESVEGTLLGKFTYDQEGEPIQTFVLLNPATEAYPMVKLEIFSNWGNKQFTCVYRFRVHGHPWEIPQ